MTIGMAGLTIMVRMTTIIMYDEYSENDYDSYDEDVSTDES